MLTFKEFIEMRWKQLDMHQAEFCRRVELPAGWVQQIRTGTKNPPLDRLPRWAAALGLEHGTRDYELFLALGAAQHVPAAHREPILRIVLQHFQKREELTAAAG